MNKIQVLVIHGGMTFRNDREYVDFLKHRPVSMKKRVSWAGEYLEKSLGKRFEIIRPRMPLQDNAKYRDWKIMFERYLELLGRDYILIGNSLGGVFLAKYLSENKLKRKALAAYLVCPPYDNSLPGEDLVGGFKLGSNLSHIEKNAHHVHLLFSADDDVVPVAHAEKYRKKLQSANIKIFKSKNGHFLVSTFPEIIKMIKSDIKESL